MLLLTYLLIYLRYGGIFNDHFVANFLLSVLVKDF